FMDRIATKLWIVEDGSITTALGNYSDYQRMLGRRADVAPQNAPAKPDPGQENRHADHVPENGHLDSSIEGTGPVSISAKGKPRRRGEGDIQKSLGQAERDISRLEGRLNDLSDALAIASIDKDVEAVARLGEEYERIQGELDDAYARWETVTRSAEVPV
ncbi:MAG TPA: ABC transporter C-terminal domain-containing protein, partial [Thermomicrobiales bacterium]|nr:ABC transporter C-terminal domain-containing protein [Thermomicrobiales bacterium]